MTTTLQRESGKRLPMLLLPVIAVITIVKGVQVLVRNLKTRKERRQLSITNYDGMMDELMAQEMDK